MVSLMRFKVCVGVRGGGGGGGRGRGGIPCFTKNCYRRDCRTFELSLSRNVDGFRFMMTTFSLESIDVAISHIYVGYTLYSNVLQVLIVYRQKHKA